jgi:hypothetical protein
MMWLGSALCLAERKTPPEAHDSEVAGFRFGEQRHTKYSALTSSTASSFSSESAAKIGLSFVGAALGTDCKAAASMHQSSS